MVAPGRPRGDATQISSQAPARVPGRPITEDIPAITAPPSAREIPFDYVAVFPLKGAPNRVEEVINISVEGAFVATAIAYSVFPQRQGRTEGDFNALLEALKPILDRPGGDEGEEFADPEEAERRERERRENREFAEAAARVAGTLTGTLSEALKCVQTRLCGFEFLYAIVDSGSGRELQNRPIHSIAGLGEPNGRRPFRPFSRPMLFLPRSTIRIVVDEVLQDPYYDGAQLYMVLHGYKVLGYGVAR